MRVRRLFTLVVAVLAVAAVGGLVAVVVLERGGSEGQPSDLGALVGSPAESADAVEQIVAERDQRYVGPLIDLMRAAEIGLPDLSLESVQAAAALEGLTGELAPSQEPAGVSA